jgi:hypothetical protein
VPGRPDFLIDDGEERFYLEAVTEFSGIVEEGRHVGREAWILDALDQGRSPNFSVSLSFDQVGLERPTTRQVVGPVEKWLADLDPDEVSASITAGEAAPTFALAFRDWRIELEAWPIPAEARGDPDRRLVGAGPGSTGFVNDREKLRNALARKRKRHGDVDAPLVIAALAMSSFLDELDVTQALFGSEALEIDSGRLVRKPDGFWRGPRGASATPVSAVLVGSRIHPSSFARTWPRLWLNPWADRPLQTDLPFPRAHVEAEKLVFTDETRPAYNVLGLPPDWPGDPQSRFDPTGD